MVKMVEYDKRNETDTRYCLNYSLLMDPSFDSRLSKTIEKINNLKKRLKEQRDCNSIDDKLEM